MDARARKRYANGVTSRSPCLLLALLLGAAFLFPPPAHAAVDPALQAVVRVDCAGRQGSGSVINGDVGYVLTDAHVAIDIHTKKPADSCLVSFIQSATGVPTYFFRAAILKYIFDEQRNEDFAILQIGEQTSAETISKPFPFLKTNEFSVVGEGLSLHGFSQGGERLISRSGVIQKFEHGFIQTDAEISPGDSGGAALDGNDRLIGIPTRIVTLTNGDSIIVNYELQDIRAVMNWLDTYGPNEHDKYFIHEDYQRYHQSAAFIASADLDCEYTARTVLTPTVYCLMTTGDRLVFPNDATFFSWYADYSPVIMVTPDSVNEYPIIRNATYKPGSLVKSQTMAAVYVVVDSFGTLRWIPSEEKAKNLWGPNWAALIKDIPDEFWTNYTLGQPLDP